jgi:hypothetical protein
LGPRQRKRRTKRRGVEKREEEEGTNVDAEVRNRRRSSLWKLCLLCEICMMFDSASLHKTEEKNLLEMGVRDREVQ